MKRDSSGHQLLVAKHVDIGHEVVARALTTIITTRRRGRRDTSRGGTLSHLRHWKQTAAFHLKHSSGRCVWPLLNPTTPRILRRRFWRG